MNKLITTAVAASLSLASLAAHADSSRFEGATRDAWITGKVETAFVLNRHLNPFAINTDVEGGAVHLTGVVEDDIDRDLAEEVAKGIEGVTDVDNDLEVDRDRAEMAEGKTKGKRDFGSWVDDATTTAAIKSKLLASPNTKGLQIDVDTADDVVTLSGSVASEQERDLAEEIARNTGDVEDVRNLLIVNRP
jgi:hyperosmotically inducible periplasmic protein